MEDEILEDLLLPLERPYYKCEPIRRITFFLGNFEAQISEKVLGLLDNALAEQIRELIPQHDGARVNRHMALIEFAANIVHAPIFQPDMREELDQLVYDAKNPDIITLEDVDKAADMNEEPIDPGDGSEPPNFEYSKDELVRRRLQKLLSELADENPAFIAEAIGMWANAG